ncbi:hypothetical protein BZL30_7554 [Mycobacterium kansasii]|uniref:Uncharacterized protein n=1 Tax=Mycobacterium kansasii TaxID=1768 RepID=A0A1V3WL84_MYCKA|nr:hypothetical protein BZL30_7554 [Mycobacterium kansasii]
MWCFIVGIPFDFFLEIWTIRLSSVARPRPSAGMRKFAPRGVVRWRSVPTPRTPFR